MSEKYVLMHKNHEVMNLQFENGKLVGLGQIYDELHLPIIRSSISISPDFRAICDWWYRRGISSLRVDIHDLLNNFRDTYNFYEMEFLASGRSLSDQYWIRPCGSEVKYSEMNFIENKFSNDVSEYIICNRYAGENIDFNTPSVVVDGNQSKAWIIRDNKRYPFKKSMFVDSGEVIVEKIASDIYEYLGIPHIGYEVMLMMGVKGSICECGISTNEDFVNAYDIMNNKYPFKQWTFKDYRKFLKDNDLEDNVGYMLLVDNIIRNTDRHWRNLGLVRDVETGEFTRTFPIFDSGGGLWFDIPDNHIDNGSVVNKLTGRLFRDDLKDVDISEDMMSKLSDIIDIVEKDLREFGMRRERVDIIVRNVKERVNDILRYFR